MLKFISRTKIEKDQNHAIWCDLLVDDETGIEYFHIDGHLSPRYKLIPKDSNLLELSLMKNV